MDRFSRLFRRRNLEKDLDKELRFHLDESIAEHMADGVPDAEAQRRAHAEFGSVPAVKEWIRDEHTGRLAQALWRTLSQSVRMLRRRPGFALTAVGTLALGIGATAVISSLVYSVLLQPLPLPASDRLVSAGHFTKFGFVGLSNGAFVVYGEQNRTLSGLSIYRETGLNVVSGSTVDRLSGASVDHTFFATLGVRPALGRDFTGTDDIPRAAPVAIISDAYWRRAFGADSRAVGRSLLVDGVALEIVGVMPAAFAQPRGPAANPIGLVAPVDIWVPYQFDRARARSINFSFSAIGRLKDGVSPSMAEQDLEALFDRPFERYPGEVTAAEMRSSGFRASVRPLVQVVARDAGTVLWTLMAAVCLLLALAFVNVVMLILLETQWREREIAVRRALGASLGQLSRQFLVEGSLVGVLGGVVGLLFAAVGTRIVIALAPAQLPRIDEVGLHPIVAVSLLVVSVVLGLALAAPPFVRQLTCRPNTLWTQAADALRDVRTVPRKLSTGLVASQLALALILLTGAGLMLRTTWNLLRVEPGFRTDHLLLFNITLAGPKTPNAIPFHQQVLDRLSAVPGVVSATAGPFGMPIESGGFPNPVWIESVPSPAGTLPPFHPFRIVMPGYFETFGIPIVEGRPIDRRDIEQETGAVVVSQAFARRFWPNGQAIGQRLRQVPDEPWFTIVGVASNTSDAGLAAAPDTIVYWPVKGVGGETYTSLSAMSYAVHTVTDPGRLAASIRDALREVAPQIPVASMRTMDEARASSMSRVTFTMTILAVGAIMAILIAAVGTYGVVAYTVSRRTKEIGVRMALGATARRIRRMVLQEGLQVTLAGLALGLAGSAMSVRFLGTFLFQVSPLDPVTYAAVTLVGLCVAALACLIPARRASRVDPLVALRAD